MLFLTFYLGFCSAYVLAARFDAFLQTVHSNLLQKSDEDEAKRRKVEKAGGGGEAAYHPIKLSRSDLYKPPTAEELNQLKEAESLFHCSLLKMQVRRLPFTSTHKSEPALVFVCASQNAFCLTTDGRAAQRGGSK